MIGFLIKTSIRALMLACALYVFFFVKVGTRTLYEHTSRISATPEAKELGNDLSTLADEEVIQPTKAIIEAKPWDRLHASRASE